MRTQFDLPVATNRQRAPLPSLLVARQTPAVIHAATHSLLITPKQLAGELGFQALQVPHGADATLPAVHIKLKPGELLYKAGSPDHHAYVVQSGLVQMVRGDNKLPSGVTYAGSGELLALPSELKLQPRTVYALMETHVLAVAAHGLEQPDADIRLAQELMLWRLSRTMMRNCKVIYRLHDLPLNARILSGLAYLMTLATGGSVEPDLGSTKQPLALDHDVLAQWLGVPLKLLKARLLRLERIGLLNCDDDAIRSIDLFTLAQLAPPLATG